MVFIINKFYYIKKEFLLNTIFIKFNVVALFPNINFTKNILC